MFVEFHTAKGENITINLASVICVFPYRKGSTLVFSDGLTQDVIEPYAEIVDKLRAFCSFQNSKI